MRIVALGGTGFLSSAVVEAAREAGHELVVVSRGQHGEPPAGLAWVRADREDPAADFGLGERSYGERRVNSSSATP